MSVSSRPRHPITGRRFILTARTPRELGAYLHRLDSLRTELRLNMRTPEEIDRELRHLQHGPVVLERAAVAYLTRPLADNTKKRVRSLITEGRSGHLCVLLAIPVAALNAPLLSDWIASLERAGLHGTSIQTIWRTLRAIVRHAAEKGWIGALPWGPWRPKLRATPKRELREATRSREELRVLLEAAAALDRERGAPSCLEPMIACMALLGLRQGELAGLRWSDVEIGDGWISVLIARQWTGLALKGKAQPTRIEADPSLEPILMRHRARSYRGEYFNVKTPIFPRENGAPYARGQVLSSLNLRACVRRANLPHVASWSPHSLRDSFVTLEAIRAEGDLRAVAARSRHATLTSLVRYLRARTRDKTPPPMLSPASDIAESAPPGT
jgi:integrase